MADVDDVRTRFLAEMIGEREHEVSWQVRTIVVGDETGTRDPRRALLVPLRRCKGRQRGPQQQPLPPRPPPEAVDQGKTVLTGQEKLKKMGTMYPGCWMPLFPRTGVVTSPKVQGVSVSMLFW